MNNDLTAHALGEYFFGCGSGIERFMCMAIGTGLGAALIVEGKPLIIDGGNSGNTGLIILDAGCPARRQRHSRLCGRLVRRGGDRAAGA